MRGIRGGPKAKRTCFLLILILVVFQIIPTISAAASNTDANDDGSTTTPFTDIFSGNDAEDTSTATSSGNVLVIEGKNDNPTDENADENDDNTQTDDQTESSTTSTSSTSSTTPVTDDTTSTTSTTTPTNTQTPDPDESQSNTATETPTTDDTTSKDRYNIAIRQADPTLKIIAPSSIKSGEDIQLQVITENGQPLQDATVTLFGESTTNTQGYAPFSIPTTAQGKYIANAAKDGYQKTYSVIRVTPKGYGAPFIKAAEDSSELVNFQNSMRQFLLKILSRV